MSSTIKDFRLRPLNGTERKLKMLVDLFLVCVGTENADVFHLPYSGGALEQPYKTMTCWKICKGVLAKHIADEHKKNAQQLKNKRR